ncbi:hypothetical protein B296_00030833 [Ensete ventricosum]|uniref:Uncharacterized protein n=1 Tax=Ensete ventricosum TaxID=4639 RepID=A0A427AG28_ENSVE|nr:hypothetical protein B296_00030833 [Ensete ventricosum]
MSVLLMEAAVSSLVLSLEARLDQIGKPEKPLLSDLEKNLLRVSRIKGDWWDSSLPWLKPRSEVALGLSRALAKKFNSNSLQARIVLDDSEVFERQVSIRCCCAPYSTVVFV